jgi:ribonuclease HI
MKRYIVATDGGVAPSNPGPGTIAYIVRSYLDGHLVAENTCVAHLAPPDTTNNVCELFAIYACLETNGWDRGAEVEIITDSLNAYSWLRGEYQMNDPHIREMVQRIWTVVDTLGIVVTWRHVRGHTARPGTLPEILNTKCDDMIRALRMEA